MSDFEKRKGRRIEANGVKWVWRTGKGGNVVAHSENGERRLGQAWKIKGLSCPDDFDRGKWKRTSDGMLMPSEVRSWLEEAQ